MDSVENDGGGIVDDGFNDLEGVMCTVDENIYDNDDNDNFSNGEGDDDANV